MCTDNLWHEYPGLSLAIRIFTKGKFVSENAKTNLIPFAAFAKQYLVESARFNTEICEKRFQNATKKIVMSTFAKEILGLVLA